MSQDLSFLETRGSRWLAQELCILRPICLSICHKSESQQAVQVLYTILLKRIQSSCCLSLSKQWPHDFDRDHRLLECIFSHPVIEKISRTPCQPHPWIILSFSFRMFIHHWNRWGYRCYWAQECGSLLTEAYSQALCLCVQHSLSA